MTPAKAEACGAYRQSCLHASARQRNRRWRARRVAGHRHAAARATTSRSACRRLQTSKSAMELASLARSHRSNVYPVPVTLIWEICTLALPVFVIVSLFVDDVPVLTFPKCKAGAAERKRLRNGNTCTAQRYSRWRIGELLTMLTEPARLPAVVGRKHRIKMLRSRRCNRGRTESIYCVSRSTDAQLRIVSEAVSRVCDRERLRFCLPVNDAAKVEACGTYGYSGLHACTVSGIVRGEPVPLLVTVTVPVAAPTAVGANVNGQSRLLEGFSVAGAVMPLAANPAPDTVTPVICSDPVPEFVSTICFTELVPVPTFPKLKLLALACRVPVGVCCSGAAQRDSQRRICGVVAGDGKASRRGSRGSRAKRQRHGG